MGGALQQGYNPQGMYNVVYNPETASFENIGFTPSDRPAIQSTLAGGPSKGAPQQGYNPYGMYGNQGGFTPSGQPSGFGRSPYSVQNIIQRDRMMGSYNPYSMGMVPNYATTSYMNPYSSPYSRPYFPQTTGSFFRSNAPAYGFYGQPETFGRPGPGYPDPFGVYDPYRNFGMPMPGASPYRPPTQMGGKGGAGGGKGGGQIQQGYDPYAMYDPTLKSKAQAFADAARRREFNEYFQEQARLEAERLAGRRPSEAGDVPLRPR